MSSSPICSVAIRAAYVSAAASHPFVPAFSPRLPIRAVNPVHANDRMRLKVRIVSPRQSRRFETRLTRNDRWHALATVSRVSSFLFYFLSSKLTVSDDLWRAHVPLGFAEIHLVDVSRQDLSFFAVARVHLTFASAHVPSATPPTSFPSVRTSTCRPQARLVASQSFASRMPSRTSRFPSKPVFLVLQEFKPIFSLPVSSFPSMHNMHPIWHPHMQMNRPTHNSQRQAWCDRELHSRSS